MSALTWEGRLSSCPYSPREMPCVAPRTEIAAAALSERSRRAQVNTFSWMLLFCLSGFAVRAQTLALPQYREKLAAIQAALEKSDLAATQIAARELEGATIQSSGASFDSDSSILAPLLKAKNSGDAKTLEPRIKALLNALPVNDAAMPPTATTNAAGIEQLERLRHDEALSLPPKDGEISGDEIVNSSVFKAIRDAAIDFKNWLADLGERFLRWLRTLFPSEKSTAGPGGISNLVLKIAVVAFAAAAIVMTIYILRKNDALKSSSGGALSDVPKTSSKDADPTSRNAAQWEQYAAQLAAAGQHREAIRACYHAQLAALFRSGILNYRKGRTNWEYCYALPAHAAWRERFLDLTRYFEHEWYGRHQSAADDYAVYASATKQLLAETRGNDMRATDTKGA